MKHSWILTFVICLGCVNSLYAWNDPDFVTLYAGKDTSVSFVVYTPGGTPEELRSRPAFFFFDPWGNGSYPLTIYKQLAERYGFALIGSNSSRNGMEFEEIARDFNLVFNELTGKYRLKPGMICLSGFSGASKVALKTSSSQSSIPYVVYGGATIDVSLSGKQVLGFAGTGDMNYTDLLDYEARLNIMPGIRHFMIEYDGGHAWFEPSVMEYSFMWMKLNLMRDHALPADTEFIQTVKEKLKLQTDSLMAAHQFMKAEQTAKMAVYFLEDLAPAGWFAARSVEIGKNTSVKKQKKEMEEVLQKERETKREYEHDFFSKDTAWWKEAVLQLRSGKERLSDERLLGFIGISCYYTANDALQQSNLNVAEKILSVYRIAFPESAEQNFLHAVLWAKKNDPLKSDACFLEAKRNGFKEWDKNTGETILQYFRRRPLK